QHCYTIGGCCKLSHHTLYAESAGASMSLSPALGNDVHDVATLAFLPVVFARPLPVRTRRAGAHLAAVERRRGPQPKRRIDLAAKGLGEQPAIRNERGDGSDAPGIGFHVDRATEQQVALTAIVS